MKFARHIFSIALILLAATTAFAQDDTTGVIYQTTNVRSGPDTRFPIVGQLSEGDRVPVTGQDAGGRWLRVTMPDDDDMSGWLPVYALIVEGDLNAVPLISGEAEGTPIPNASVIVISYGRVNVRSGPGVEFEIVAQLDVDERAPALARSNRSNDWLLIEIDDEQGWVAYFTVDVEGDPRALPVLVPDSAGGLIPPSRLLRTLFNVRLHATPELASPVTLIIPFNSEVTPIGRNERGDWLYVGYESEAGWGVRQLFDITPEELDALDVLDDDGEPVPTTAVTLAPTITVTPQTPTTAPTAEVSTPVPTAEVTDES